METVNTQDESVISRLMKVKKKFPKFIDIYEKDGRVKNTKHWKKAYEYGRTVTDVTETQHYLESIQNG